MAELLASARAAWFLSAAVVFVDRGPRSSSFGFLLRNASLFITLGDVIGYLTEVDRMLERAKEATRYSKYTGVEYARFADDLVILIDAHPRHDWLMAAVEKRLREELAGSRFSVYFDLSPRGMSASSETLKLTVFHVLKVPRVLGRPPFNGASADLRPAHSKIDWKFSSLRQQFRFEDDVVRRKLAEPQSAPGLLRLRPGTFAHAEGSPGTCEEITSRRRFGRMS